MIPQDLGITMDVCGCDEELCNLNCAACDDGNGANANAGASAAVAVFVAIASVAA